jgi:hypothetical protein
MIQPRCDRSSLRRFADSRDFGPSRAAIAGV